MKKAFMILGAAALALVACNKSEVVVNEAPAEMSFKAMSSNTTKGAELTGTVLPEEYGIYAAATQKNANGVIENPNFFSETEQHFDTPDAPPTATSLWYAFPTPIYWPIGGVKMDFLAYAMPQDDYNGMASSSAAAADWTAFWNNAATDVATKVSFNGVDTYANQVDVLYSSANGQTSAANGNTATNGRSTPMTFKHAQALLIFNVKVNEGAQIKIKEIGYYTDARVKAMREDQVKVAGGETTALAALSDDDVTLKTVGTFTVDNSRNNLVAEWSDLSAKKENAKMPDYTEATPAVSSSNITDATTTQKYDVLIPVVANDKYAQLGETLLIPEQPKENFTITYTIGDKTCFYTFNDFRGNWEKGKKYIYNIEFQLNEIAITENVLDFVDGEVDPISL